ncbi:MAG: zinc-binding alcohol dehydrogenase family protein [Gemmatimonadaceae bacterium]
MRGLGVFGALGVDADTLPCREHLIVDGMMVRSAFVPLREPRFEPQRHAYAHQVLVRVNAFSCNYRDKGFFRDLHRLPGNRCRVIGSEFAGIVMAVGARVTHVRVGDRVIGQNAYHRLSPADAASPAGLPTNSASRELLVLHERKVAVLPECMSSTDAAAFSVGAQTAFSMMRRAQVHPGALALVTSATSNTSLSLIAALRLAGVRVIAATASTGCEARLSSLGAEAVVSTEQLGDACRARGELAFVFDPFFDLHLERSVELLAPFGTYVTCGFAGQNDATRASVGAAVNAESVMRHAIVKNLVIIGNCLGAAGDLTDALGAWLQGRMPVVIDSVHRGDDAPAFLARTFVDRRRFGKVVFSYEADVTAGTALA